MKKKNNDDGVILISLGLIVIMAARPPIGVILVLCIVLCNGTVSGFLGCLTPVVLLVILAAIVGAFS